MAPPTGRVVAPIAEAALAIGAAALAIGAAALAIGAAALAIGAPASAGASTTERLAGDAAAAEFAPGEVLVRFKGPRPERALELPPGVGVGEAVRALEANPGVSFAVPNYIARAAYIPDDPGRGGGEADWQEDQWNFLGEPGGVNAPEAWSILRQAGHPGGFRPTGERGPKVAVVDTGVAYRKKGRHFRRSPDLARDAFARGRDFVKGGALALDRNGHGTHVASTIVERVNNGRAVTGLAYGVQVMPVRVLGGDGNGTAANVARGIRWSTKHGARVINLSLEFGIGAVSRCADIPGVCNAIREALKRNILVVAAAGNQGHNAVAYPARADDPADPKGVSKAGPVIAVGASTIRGCLADFSDYGEGLDLLAPGGGDDRGGKAGAHCDPFGRAPGIVQLTLRTGPAASGNFKSFGYPRFDGTSMSTPHVSATAALVIASRVAKGELGRRPSPAGLENWIEARARKTVDGVALDETYYGAGLLDLAGALTR